MIGSNRVSLRCFVPAKAGAAPVSDASQCATDHQRVDCVLVRKVRVREKRAWWIVTSPPKLRVRSGGVATVGDNTEQGEMADEIRDPALKLERRVRSPHGDTVVSEAAKPSGESTPARISGRPWMAMTEAVTQYGRGVGAPLPIAQRFGDQRAFNDTADAMAWRPERMPSVFTLAGRTRAKANKATAHQRDLVLSGRLWPLHLGKTLGTSAAPTSVWGGALNSHLLEVLPSYLKSMDTEEPQPGKSTVLDVVAGRSLAHARKRAQTESGSADHAVAFCFPVLPRRNR